MSDIFDKYDKGELDRGELREEIKKSEKIKEATRIRSREYERFKKGQEKRETKFEKLCEFVGKFMKFSPSGKELKNMKREIRYADLVVEPGEVMGVAILGALITLFIGVFALLITGSLFTLVFFPGAFFAYFYLKNYPKNKMQKRIVQTSSEMVLGVLYVVIYMRHTPNIEGAVRFAAKNLSGPLGKDFNKLLWDVQTKKKENIDEAMKDYLVEWKKRNPPFVEAMNLVLSSLHQTDRERRIKTLDQAVDSVLQGTYQRMVNYANGLRTPVQAVSLLGITLPILTLVMLPMVGAFMADLITPQLIFFFYDIALPVIVYGFIQSVLGTRPTGFPVPDVTKHPDAPPKGKFYLKIGDNRIAIPAWPISITIFVVGILLFGLYINSVRGNPPNKMDVFGSLPIVLGLAGMLGSYFFLQSFQLKEIRDRITSVEEEFTNASYMIGSALSEGQPLELALIKVAKNMRGSEVYDFFEKITRNIRQVGMNVEKSIFDKKEGAINLYPSLLVRSIMRILVSTSQESTEAASVAMLNIGTYTKSLHRIDDKIRDILAETISTLSFQANFIGPLITGVVVGLSTMIFLILSNLGQQISGISGEGQVGGAAGMQADFITGFLNIQSAIPVWVFQPIVGIYLVIVVTLMVYLINKINTGGDTIGFYIMCGKTLILSTIVYLIVVSVTTLLFTGISELATAGG